MTHLKGIRAFRLPISGTASRKIMAPICLLLRKNLSYILRNQVPRVDRQTTLLSYDFVSMWHRLRLHLHWAAHLCFQVGPLPRVQTLASMYGEACKKILLWAERNLARLKRRQEARSQKNPRNFLERGNIVAEHSLSQTTLWII